MKAGSVCRTIRPPTHWLENPFHGLLLRQVAHPLLRVRQMETDLTCRLFFEPQNPFDESAFARTIFSNDAQIAPSF